MPSYIVQNRVGARRRLVWDSLEPLARCVESEAGYIGPGTMMTNAERDEFAAMERDGRRSVILGEHLLTLDSKKES